MEKVMKEDSVLSEAKEAELAFWADERERELYFQEELRYLDEYSAKHTFDFLLKQERERAELEKEQALKEKEKALKEKEKENQDALRKVKLEMAHNMLKLGIDMESFVQGSGLSEEEISGKRAL